MKHFTLTLLLFGAFVACSGPGQITEMLDRAEVQMSEHPDSAKIVLESIDRQSLRTRRARARFALLYSQALDKNYIDVDQDTLAHIATRFYKNHGTPNEKALAYYYRGRVYKNANDIDSAIIFYTEAEKHIEKTSNTYLKGLIANALAKMYTQQNFKDLAISKYLESASYFEECDSKINALRSYIGALGFLSLMHNYNEQNRLLNHCDSIAYNINNKQITGFLTSSRARMIINRDSNYLEALHILYDTNEKTTPSSYYPILTPIYYNLGLLDSASLYANYWLKNQGAISPHDKIEALYYLAKISNLTNNYKIAYQYTSDALRICDSLYYVEKEHAIPELKEKYRNEQLILETQYLNKIGKYQRYIASIFILVVITFSAWLIRSRQRKIQVQIQEIADCRNMIARLQNEYETLQNSAANRQGLTAADEQKIERRIAFLKQLLDITIRYKRDMTKFQQKMEELLLKASSGSSNSNEFFLLIQDIVDMKCPGIIEFMHARYPQLNHQELTLYCMVCLGIEKAAVCVLFKCQPKTYYNYRNLLRNKLGIANEELSIPEHFQQMCTAFRTQNF